MSSPNDKQPAPKRLEPVTIRHCQGWEIIGLFAAIAAFGVLLVSGSVAWAIMLMPLAIYCAAMR